MTTVSTLSTLPEAPTREMASSEFAEKADLFLPGLNTLQTEMNTSIGQINTVAGEINTNAGTASTAAGTATTQAGIATTQASTATTKAGEASTSATNAANSASTATTQAGIATTQAGIATTKAGEALTSANTATTQAGISTTKASESLASANLASGYKDTATTQAGISTTKAGEALASANTATTQAGIATTQAGLATTNGAAQVTLAAAQVTLATTQASNALTSANNAAASYDAFDDRYLGSKTSDPTVDNDGNALITGALYFNSVSSQMKAWSGTAWVITAPLLTDHSTLTNRDIAGNHAKLIPASDSTTAIQITKANGTSEILNIDTTNHLTTIKSNQTAATLSAELITNAADRDFSGAGNWTGTAWSVAGGVLTHTASATAVSLANTYLNEAIVAGANYLLTFTINTTTAGTLTPSVGGKSGVVVGKQVNNEIQVMAFNAVSNTTALTFTPNAAWVGTLDNISLKRITPVTASFQFKDSSGTICNAVTINGLTNIFNGIGSGQNRTTGYQNVASGYQSQYSLTTGYYNVASGSYSQYSLTTGYSNVASGDRSQFSLTTGSYNVASGDQSQFSLTTGSYNVASGSYSQYALTTGYSNVASGYNSQYNLTTGYQNVASGYNSQLSLTTGSYNVASGSYSQYNLTTGSQNVAIGYQAGRYHADGLTSLTDPENSIYIGANVKGYNNEDNNTIVIGYYAAGKGANTTVLGSSAITNTTIGGNILPYTADTYDIGSATLQYDDIYATNATIQTSDARLKENVVDLYISSAFLEKLRPVSFKWKDYTIPEETTINDVHAKDENGNLLYETITETDADGIETTRQEPVFVKETVIIRPEIIKTHTRKHCGLIAQEVEQAILDIGMTTEDFAALCYDSETDRYSVRYVELIPVLIRGWQDQQAKIKDLEARLIALESK